MASAYARQARWSVAEPVRPAVAATAMHQILADQVSNVVRQMAARTLKPKGTVAPAASLVIFADPMCAQTECVSASLILAPANALAASCATRSLVANVWMASPTASQIV